MEDIHRHITCAQFIWYPKIEQQVPSHTRYVHSPSGCLSCSCRHFLSELHFPVTPNLGLGFGRKNENHGRKNKQTHNQQKCPFFQICCSVLWNVFPLMLLTWHGGMQWSHEFRLGEKKNQIIRGERLSGARLIDTRRNFPPSFAAETCHRVTIAYRLRHNT